MTQEEARDAIALMQPDMRPLIQGLAALDYVNGVGLDAIAAWEQDLLQYATERVRG